MPALKNPRWEQFAGFVAAGKTAAESYVCAGYREANAPFSGSRLAKVDKVATRIDELRTLAQASRATQEWLTRGFVMESLKLVIEKAFELNKLSDVVASAKLLGQEIGMFREQHDHNLQWDGDPTKLSARQLSRLLLYFEALADGRDPAGQVVDVQAQKVLTQ